MGSTPFELRQSHREQHLLCDARPDIREAVGIDINGGSSTNIVRRNTVSNQDSGINVYNGSNNVLVVRNITHDNGDHGFDTV